MYYMISLIIFTETPRLSEECYKELYKAPETLQKVKDASKLGYSVANRTNAKPVDAAQIEKLA